MLTRGAGTGGQDTAYRVIFYWWWSFSGLCLLRCLYLHPHLAAANYLHIHSFHVWQELVMWSQGEKAVGSGQVLYRSEPGWRECALLRRYLHAKPSND